MGKEINVELDNPRTQMYEEMVDIVGKDSLDELLDERLHQLITHLYDTKEE